MRKLSIYFLLTGVVMILYGCPESHSCPECADVDMRLLYPGDSLQTDSIKIMSSGFRRMAGYGRPHSAQDSSDYQLTLDVPRDSSTFLFYHARRPTDTLVFRHQFVKQYDDKCEDYYFELVSMTVVRSTFSEERLKRIGKFRTCYELEASL